MLINIQRSYQLDSIQKQQITQKVGAEFGSLAFLYAKHVWQGLRSLDSLPPIYKDVVPEIHAYVKEKGYQQIMD